MESRLQVVGGDLTIDPVMLSDDGSFKCEASNIVGMIQVTVYLNVQCKYQATQLTNHVTLLYSYIYLDLFLMCNMSSIRHQVSLMYAISFPMIIIKPCII